MTAVDRPRRDTASHVRLEALLDERSQPGDAFAPAVLRELDDGEEFPAEACRMLDEFGLADYYVPATHGGKLVDVAELIQLIRCVARRDLTVAVAHAKTLLGAAPVWVAGDRTQADELAESVLDGRIVSWALTERGHGADLLAGELSARRAETGWTLRGEKWLINNATRADLVCVLARTGEAGDARGFGLFLVDKRDLSTSDYEPLPKVPTHGIRGADISGIRFADATVPESAAVGGDGAGLEIVLKALQLTRTMCSGLSLGACDNALRLATAFVRERRLYGRLLVELPRIRRILADAAADLLLMEAVSFVAGRAVCSLPAEMAVVSSVAKAFVPSTGESLIAELGEILGVRAFFAETYAEGAFAKLERDHRIVGIFDGSTDVNRHALIKQFPLLARANARRACDREGLAKATTLAAPAEGLDLTSLGLVSHGGCSVLQGLPEAVDEVVTVVRDGGAPPELESLSDELLAAATDVASALAEHKAAVGDVPTADFDLARRYELCFAGAAALRLWLHNRERHDGLAIWEDATWLRACLSRVLRTLGRAGVDHSAAGEVLVEELVRTKGRGMTLLVEG